MLKPVKISRFAVATVSQPCRLQNVSGRAQLRFLSLSPHPLFSLSQTSPTFALPGFSWGLVLKSSYEVWGSAVRSPSGYGWRPATKQFLVHSKIKKTYTSSHSCIDQYLILREATGIPDRTVVLCLFSRFVCR